MAMAAHPSAAAVEQCVADIEVCDLVALDFEFSGLFLDMERGVTPPLPEYYRKCAKSVPHFLPLQMGVCCARQMPEESSWELRVHEFNLWPTQRRVFTSDLQSLRFLRTHGFDFNTFFEEAYEYARLPPAADSKRAPLKHKVPWASKVLDEIRKAKVPLIFHNGLLDMLHIYDKFIGDLPLEVGSFCQAWLQEFPMLFDTRLIAAEGRTKVFQHPSGLTLGELHRHLTSMPEVKVLFERTGPVGDKSKAARQHGSSGYDAMLTAELFLLEMDLWIRTTLPKNGRKKRRVSQGGEPQGGGNGDSGSDDHWETVGKKRGRSSSTDVLGLTSPTLLVNHEACQQFQNRVALVATTAPFLDLALPGSGGPAAGTSDGSAVKRPAPAPFGIGGPRFLGGLAATALGELRRQKAEGHLRP